MKKKRSAAASTGAVENWSGAEEAELLRPDCCCCCCVCQVLHPDRELQLNQYCLWMLDALGPSGPTKQLDSFRPIRNEPSFRPRMKGKKLPAEGWWRVERRRKLRGDGSCRRNSPALLPG